MTSPHLSATLDPHYGTVSFRVRACGSEPSRAAVLYPGELRQLIVELNEYARFLEEATRRRSTVKAARERANRE